MSGFSKDKSDKSLCFSYLLIGKTFLLLPWMEITARKWYSTV